MEREVSLIIPVKNEAKVIRALFAMLKLQTIRPTEIIITDGGSTDGTIDIIKEYIAQLPLRLICASSALPGRGRNLAIRQASSKLIVSTDAGCNFDSLFVEELVAPFGVSSVDVVYGSVVPESRTTLEKCIVSATFNPEFMPSVACMAFKKSVWENIGGYPETLRTSEDYLFIKKIEKAGYNVIINEKAKVYWRPRSSIASFFNQYYLYTKGKGQIRIDLFFHLRKLAIYCTILVMLVFAIRFHSFLLVVMGLAILILWIVFAIKKHWKWFDEIKHLPQTYLLFPMVILVRDMAALLGYLVGWIEGTTDNVEIN